jgi:hypothetical protein
MREVREPSIIEQTSNIKGGTRPRPRMWLKHIEAYVLHVSWLRHQPPHKRLPHILRIQKKNGPRPQLASATILNQRSEPHHVVGTSPPTISSPLFFSHTHPKLAKDNLRTITNLIIMPQPTTANLL